MTGKARLIRAAPYLQTNDPVPCSFPYIEREHTRNACFRKSLRQNTANLFGKIPQISSEKCHKSLRSALLIYTLLL